MNGWFINSNELTFEEFSFLTKEGEFQPISQSSFQALTRYMVEQYPQIERIEEFHHNLILWCKDSVPSPQERESMIASLRAVWLVEGKDEIPEGLDPGCKGLSAPLKLDQTLLDDLKVFLFPSTETLKRIQEQHFPDALAIGYSYDRIIVELEEASEEEWTGVLERLPGSIEGSRMGIRFWNGWRGPGY